MTGQSRTESQQHNREVVLDVARAAFLRDGYVATSVASIAKDAGFTTGIVYSSFGSKADLALRVLERLQTQQIAVLAEGVSDAISPEDVLAHVRVWAAQASASGWVRLELELLLDTINDPRLATAQAARQGSAVAQATGVVRSLLSIETLDESTVEIVAEAAVDYAIGVAVRHVTNPQASPDRFLQLLRPLLAAVAH